ncbi:MAG: protein kinase [Planctomycetota bacterium]
MSSPRTPAEALALLGLSADAPRSTWEPAWKAKRKPLLKQLNQYDAGKEPAGVVAALEHVEAAWRILRELPAVTTGAAEPGEADEAPSESAGSGSGAASHATVRPLLDAGALLFERYEIRTLISHRPEGDTYRVRDRQRGVDVALKIVDTAVVRDARQRAQLRQDLLAARRAIHPGVVRVLDVLDLQHTLVVISALPRGTNLWDRVLDGPARGKGLERRDFERVARGALAALAGLHATQAHGALRPESVWIDDDGHVQISDHGFDHVVPALRERRLSRTKLGTAYWAPEQMKGATTETELVDQYALALVLYEALAGRPSVGRTVRVNTFRRDIPGRQRAALERALHTNPDRRFADVDAWAQAAFGSIATERTTPRATGTLASALPALVGVALAVGLAFSPPGADVRDRTAAAVDRWSAAEAAADEVDGDVRALRRLAGRLAAQRQSLPKESQERLDAVVRQVEQASLDEGTRTEAGAALASLVGDVVATARDAALAARSDADEAWDAVEAKLTAELEAATAALRAAQGELAGGTAEDATLAAWRVADARATQDALDRRASSHRVRAHGGENIARGERALARALAARAVGDEGATTAAYEEARAAFAAAADLARSEIAQLEPTSPGQAAAPTEIALDEDARRALVDLMMPRAEELVAAPDGCPDITGAVRTLRETLFASAQGRVLVSEGNVRGGLALEATCAGRTLRAAASWTMTLEDRTLRATLLDGDVVRELPAADVGGRLQPPTPTQLVALLAPEAATERALWSRRTADEAPLPRPVLRDRERVTRAGELRVDGVWVGPAAGLVLIDGRIADRTHDDVVARVTVPGDVVATAVRAHGVEGLASGPATWMQVAVDGLAPRIHLLGAPDGGMVEAGQEVTVRLLVADSHLTRLVIGGQDVDLRPDDLYVVQERKLVAPARGRLTLAVSAVDAAGNTRSEDYAWAVR